MSFNRRANSLTPAVWFGRWAANAVLRCFSLHCSDRANFARVVPDLKRYLWVLSESNLSETKRLGGPNPILRDPHSVCSNRAHVFRWLEQVNRPDFSIENAP